MKSHLAKRVILAQTVARAFSRSLDLSEDYLDRFFRHLGVVSIINYYPPLSLEALKRAQWSFSPHTDYGGFTLLSQDDLGACRCAMPPANGSMCRQSMERLSSISEPNGDLDK